MPAVLYRIDLRPAVLIVGRTPEGSVKAAAKRWMEAADELRPKGGRVLDLSVR